MMDWVLDGHNDCIDASDEGNNNNNTYYYYYYYYVF